MDLSAYYKIGYVMKTHGLRGEVTISLSPVAPDLEEIDALFIEQKGSLVPHFIESHSLKSEKAFVKFEGTENIEHAERLKGCSIYLMKESRPRSGRGQFYFDEVVDFIVTDEGSGLLGHVVAVSSQANNPQLIIHRDKNKKEILIPINGPFIKSVNKSKKTISVSLPDGFLDI
jgi:16S rRNA processing protein RimM